MVVEPDFWTEKSVRFRAFGKTYPPYMARKAHFAPFRPYLYLYSYSKDNKLSLWQIEDDNSNLEQVIAAYVSVWGKPDKIAFILFPAEVIDGLGLRSEQQPGNTFDQAANLWHINLVELTGSKIVSLIRGILDHGHSVDQRDTEEISNLLALSVQAAYIPFVKLSRPWQTQLNERLSQQGLL